MARVEIKDVRIPVQLQRSMAAEAEATREARARVRAILSTLEGKMPSFGVHKARPGMEDQTFSVILIREGFLFHSFY